MPKKRVLIAGNSSFGLKSFRTELIIELLKEYDVYLSSPFEKEHKAFFKAMGCICIDTFIDRRGMNPINDSVLFLNYIKIIFTYKIDFIFSYTIKPNLYCGLAAILLKKPYITTINGLGTALQKESNLQKILIKFFSLICRQARHVFFQNFAIKKFFYCKSICTEKNSSVINGSGVNIEKFQMLPYPVEETPISFLYIGRMMDEKGIPELMEAAKRVVADFPDIEFHLIGACEDNYEEKMQKWQKQKNIFYHGIQNDVRPFLKKSHCLVHPTYYPEGISNVCLEAAAVARPIIASDIPGCYETFNDGVSGFKVKRKNVDDLEAVLRRFIKLSYMERIQMGVAGHNKVEKEFNRTQIVIHYLKKLKNK